MKSVVGYVRVSTADQNVSPGMQTAKIRAYCELNDLGLSEVIVDDGVSAKNITGRPGFQRALDMVFTGKADGLICWKLDRCFRSTSDALLISDKLNKLGKDLISVNERIDTTTSMGRLYYTITSAFAEFERNIIGERTSAALQSMKADGKRVGEIPFGFTLADDGKHLDEDAHEQGVISRIHNLKALGYSFRQIAADLNQDGYRTKKGSDWTHRQVAMVYQRAA